MVPTNLQVIALAICLLWEGILASPEFIFGVMFRAGKIKIMGWLWKDPERKLQMLFGEVMLLLFLVLCFQLSVASVSLPE